MGEEKTISELTRAVVVHPHLPRETSKISPQLQRSPQAKLEEAVGLAFAIDLEVTHTEVVSISQFKAGTLLGLGVVERLKSQILMDKADLLIVDYSLSPIQQRNLEKELKCKVIDRTGLILEIFGKRARTYEGRLQVELAALAYQRSRLVRSWTHLERQRGGFGFMGGPGERQIEMDRRIIDDRIIKIKSDLEKVKKTRSLHRVARQKVPYPIVTLVGYTNAGKSTLFNQLTGAAVLAKDILFATLDPTLRQLLLPSRRKIILSDTVGFISDLPTHLVAAFRATLGEVLEADVIIHVRDISHEDTEVQKNDVLKVLTELGVSPERLEKQIYVFNKVDLLDEVQQQNLNQLLQAHKLSLGVSAITGFGCDKLLDMIDQVIREQDKCIRVEIDSVDGEAIAWLYQHGKVIHREENEMKITLIVELSPKDVERFKKIYFQYEIN